MSRKSTQGKLMTRFFYCFLLLTLLPYFGTCFTPIQDSSRCGLPRFLASKSSETSTSSKAPQLTEEQKDFTMGYLNKHHKDLLLKFAEAFSPLGQEMADANVWSGGSMSLKDCQLVFVSEQELGLQVTVQKRGKDDTMEDVMVDVDAEPVKGRKRFYSQVDPVGEYLLDTPPNAMDQLVRKLNRLCWIVDTPEVTGKLIQLAAQKGGAGVGKLPENMYLNQVPHNRYVRQYFYDQVTQATLQAVLLCSQRKISNRMKVISQFPEMNPSMDSYRIGTILEMVRDMAIRLAEENLRVRVCVQGSMGVGIFTGVPKQLSGVSKLLQMMDWQSEVGEVNQGMVGDFIRFGEVGAQHVINEERDDDYKIVQYQDDVFIIIAPQSMVGTDSSIIPLLKDMVEAAGDRPVILLNPDLTDKVSAAGQQNVRGRQDRIDFADSFQTIYHFQNIYVSGTSYFPILGAITKLRPTEPYVAHQRLDYADGDGEIYMPILSSENKPSGESIMKTFQT